MNKKFYRVNSFGDFEHGLCGSLSQDWRADYPSRFYFYGEQFLRQGAVVRDGVTSRAYAPSSKNRDVSPANIHDVGDALEVAFFKLTNHGLKKQENLTGGGLF